MAGSLPLRILGATVGHLTMVLGFAVPGHVAQPDLHGRTQGIALLRAEGPDRYRCDGVAGGYTAFIGPEGFQLDDAVLGHVRFAVEGMGRKGSAPIPWHAGPARPTENEVYYAGSHMGVHYVRSIDGLRQNFLALVRPPGEGPLQVLLRISGDRDAELDGEDGVRFSDHAGRTVLNYRDLHCWDAQQRPLVAHLELHRDQGRTALAIVVDDRDAVYPVVIDPVATSPSTLLQGSIAGAEFGIAVATAGDLNGDGRSDVVVGAWQASLNGYNLSGAAYVYYGTNTGISTTPSVTLTSGQQGAQFGNAVSTAGDVNGDGYSDLLVGARTWESDQVNELSEGGVFVYYGSSTGIHTTPDLILQPDHAGDNFGSNVACAGDINNDGYSDVLVGAYLSSYPSTNEGAVFVYLGSASGLSSVPQHRLERNQGGAFFGRSISGAGDINGDGYSDVIVGASKFVYTSGASDQGSAFIYYGNASGLGGSFNPAPSLQLYGSGANLAYYGWWVTCAGDLNGDGYSDVAVSAYAEDNGQTDEGEVYVYRGAAGGLNTTPVAILQSNQAGAWMGRCVSTAGDVNGDGYADLLVGTPRYSNGESLEGIAQIYLGSPSGISTTASFTYELNNAGANLGESVSPAGDVNGDGYSDLILGARIYGLGGAAAIYLGGPYGTNTAPSGTTFGGAASALLGTAVANAGDVNGDGYTDAIMGAPGASNGQAGEGLAYVYYGSSTGLPATPSLILEANVAGAQFGASVASAGDVNGDGYADVVVGAPANGNGKAYLYLGTPSGLSTSPTTTLSGGLQFGSSVATAGDVNTDGFSDVIIGSPGSGEAYVYRGSAAGLITTPAAVLSQAPASGLFGCSVSTAGDVNGDGYSDVIVGARNITDGQANEGAAYIFHGSVNGLVTPYARVLEVDQANADFGVSVSSASDVNGDGFFDVIVGADLWESGQTDEGGAFLFYGSSTGVQGTGYVTLQRNITNGHLGRSVAEAGDVNGDGYADVIVGAPLSENPAATADEGIAYVFKGSSSGLQASGYDQLESNVAGYQFGTCVSGGGDLDGDGYSDVLVGAPVAGPSFANEGAWYWFRGDVARALDRYTRQYDADLVTPLSTNSQDFANTAWFGIGHRARGPIQRCRAKLRWEVVYEGQPFQGGPITNSVNQTAIAPAWTTLPVAGTEIKQAIFKSTWHLRYKWRVREEYDLAKLIDGQRFSRWFYGYANAIGDIGVLPIELLRFEGTAVGPVNELTWATATEHNSQRFDVLRGPTPAVMGIIGTLPAAGESQSTLQYSLVDPRPPHGTSYYRLNMVDQDGATTLSDAVAITRTEGLLSLFPNPADGAVHVLVGEHADGSHLLVLDPQGRVLLAHPVAEGSALQDLDVRQLAAGSYTVMLRDDQGATTGVLPLIVR